jgi:hypothetical protein
MRMSITMRPATFLTWLLLVALAHVGLGFSSVPISGSSSANSNQVEVSRKEALGTLCSGLLGVTTVVLTNPGVAHADITNKIASTTALRSLKQAEKILPNVLPTVKENDFLGVKAFLRTPPFDEIRKNGSIIVRGGEDGPKSNELQSTYKDLIGGIEKIDGSASLGMRGRKIPQLQLLEEYDIISASMKSFLKVAEEAVEIPLQYADR